MTPEDLQQIQAIVQATVSAAVAPITTRLDGLEQGQKNLEAGQKNLEQGQEQLTKQITAVESRLETKIAAVETKVEKSEQKIMKKLDSLEKLAADYLDGQVQTTKRRLDRVEKILNITP